eukprot:6301763-Ditylum_brightwellii.AAC.1
MFGVDCWDLIHAPKHRKCSINVCGHNGKWTVWFGGGLVDVLWANSYSTYRSIHASDKRVRRCSQYKFVTEALEKGLQWTFDALKNKNKSPFELPAEDMLEQEGVAAHLNEEYHLNYKTTHLMKNLNRTLFQDTIIIRPKQPQT